MKKCWLFLAFLSLFFISCVNPLSNDSKELYGSISIQNSESRAMDVSTITSADVVVSGYGMEDVTKTGVSVTAGKGSIVITKIPAGTNRVVTVKSNVDGAVMRAVVDIVADTTTECTVNWKGTAVGNIFYELIKTQNVAVSSISKTAFDSYIPDVHASLVDAANIASDYKNNSLGTADSYILEHGTVAVNTTGLNGWKVQITDIASEIKEIDSDSESYELNATPGTWKVWVYDASGNLREDKIQNIVIASGYTTQVDINYEEGGTPVTGKIIVHVPSSLNYSTVYAWPGHGSYSTWPGVSMGAASNGYHTCTLDSITATKIIFNNGSGGSVGNNQTADLYITEGEWNYIGGSSGTKDTDGSKISSNFESVTQSEVLEITVTEPDIPLLPTATISPLSGEISLDGTITVTLTNGNDTISAASVTLSGDVSGNYSYIDFDNNVLTINVSDLNVTEVGKSIVVNASVTNSVGTANAEQRSYTTSSATPSTPTRLGAFYEKCATSFSIWSPDSSNVKVAVKKQGESDFTEYTCTAGFTVDGGYSDTSNIYGVTVMGDCNLAEYQFYIGGKAVRDPYGRMIKYEDEDAKTNLIKANYSESNCTVSSYAGSSINIVVDVDSILPSSGSWAARPALSNRAKSVVYEIHVGDFTCDSSWGGTEAYRGKFKGMYESGTTYTSGSTTVKTGLDHLVELGVTHVQIMPMYDYATKVNQTLGEYYNWGYDPVNYNVPEDRFAEDPTDYEERIREVKDMVNTLHANGIRVIMDVVYNHTFDGEMFNKISSSYYTSVDYSGCGNSIDVTNSMVSRMVRDSLEYWAETFNLDGFRFDLMGIYSNSAIGGWGQYLNDKYTDRTLLLYGEPYKANNTNTDGYAYANSISSLNYAGVGAFSHKYRETLKGGSDDAVKGYIFNATDKDGDSTVGNVMVGLKGSGTGLGSDSEGVWTRYFTSSPYQAVNYLSAHDNLCLYDKITTAGVTSSAYAQAIVKFGHGIITLSQGVGFIHGGDDFLRTKTGDTWSEFLIDTRTAKENSYMFGQGMNKIDWSRKVTYNDLFEYNKDLIEFKKSHDGFYNGSASTSSSGMVIYYTVTDSDGTKLTCVLNPGDNITYTGGGTQVFNKSGIVSSSSTTCEGTGVTIFAQ